MKGAKFLSYVALYEDVRCMIWNFTKNGSVYLDLT